MIRKFVPSLRTIAKVVTLIFLLIVLLIVATVSYERFFGCCTSMSFDIPPRDAACKNVVPFSYENINDNIVSQNVPASVKEMEELYKRFSLALQKRSVEETLKMVSEDWHNSDLPEQNKFQPIDFDWFKSQLTTFFSLNSSIELKTTPNVISDHTSGKRSVEIGYKYSIRSLDDSSCKHHGRHYDTWIKGKDGEWKLFRTDLWDMLFTCPSSFIQQQSQNKADIEKGEIFLPNRVNVPANLFRCEGKECPLAVLEKLSFPYKYSYLFTDISFEQNDSEVVLFETMAYSGEGLLKFYSPSSGKINRALKFKSSPGYKEPFSRSDRLLFSSVGNEIHITDYLSGKVLRRFKGESGHGSLKSLTASSNNSILALAYSDGEVFTRELDSELNPAPPIPVYDKPLDYKLAFLGTKYLVLTSSDRTFWGRDFRPSMSKEIKILNLENNEIIPYPGERFVGVTKNGESFLSVAEWNFKSNSNPEILTIRRSSDLGIQSQVKIPVDPHLYCARSAATNFTENHKYESQISISGDGRLAIVKNLDGSLTAVSLESGKFVTMEAFKMPGNIEKTIRGCGIASDNKKVACIAYNGEGAVWEIPNF